MDGPGATIVFGFCIVGRYKGCRGGSGVGGGGGDGWRMFTFPDHCLIRSASECGGKGGVKNISRPWTSRFNKSNIEVLAASVLITCLHVASALSPLHALQVPLEIRILALVNATDPTTCKATLDKVRG